VKAIASGHLRNEEFGGGRAVAVFWLALALFIAGLVLWVPRHRASVGGVVRAEPAAARRVAPVRSESSVREVTSIREAKESRLLPAPVAVEAGPPSLAMPIAGLSAADLRDSFEEVHSGHRHEAIDILSPRGTPVLAVADGTVRKLFHSVPGGITVYEFDTTETLCFYYAHLERYAEGLAEGQVLRAGDRIGYVGTSGNAPPQTPHLHFAISRLGADKHWWQGTPIDPYPFLVEARRLP
jgi:murein DD-endopeptidase MepM/ murein hydrolase activator NlpD